MKDKFITSSYTSDSDLGTQCTSCYSGNTAKVGVLIIDNGFKQPVYKCSDCNDTYTKPAEGGIEILVDAARSHYDTDKVSFEPTDIAVSAGTEYAQPYDPNTYSLLTSSQNIESQLLTLSQGIEAMLAEMRNLAFRNEELLQKLATDPLLTTKKRINDFNLE